jgi:hypothetical protein
MPIYPRDNTPLSRGPRPVYSDAARRAVIEKSLTGYVLLACDHWTTNQEIEAYSFWAPKGRPVKHYCEKCGKWVPKKPKPKPIVYPDEPLF